MSARSGILQIACDLYFLWCKIYWRKDVEVFIGWPGVFSRIYISITSVSCMVHMVTGCLAVLTRNLGETRVVQGVERWLRRFSHFFACAFCFLNFFNDRDDAFGPFTHIVSLLALFASQNNWV